MAPKANGATCVTRDAVLSLEQKQSEDTPTRTPNQLPRSDKHEAGFVEGARVVRHSRLAQELSRRHCDPGFIDVTTASANRARVSRQQAEEMAAKTVFAPITLRVLAQ